MSPEKNPPTAEAGEPAGRPSLDERLTARYANRLVLISPPRTGSTAVARLLWQHSSVSYHCHEPFEAEYWGENGAQATEQILTRPMEIATGERVPLEEVAPGSGLLVKEMSFQLDAGQFGRLAALTTAPVIFVVRDPRLCATSRLRIVRELSGATTFPAFEGGWQSLGEQIAACRAGGIPYLILDSGELRSHPDLLARSLIARLGLTQEADLHTWSSRSGLRLCLPEIGELMGSARAADDPFYRRVLASDRILPADEVDFSREEAAIEAAGLTGSVAEWLMLYQGLWEDPAWITSEVGAKRS